ncbi:valine--tRNA ligase [Actinomadura soli]|uniref:Valine--tRNA ligase n=1 Tax=Actinomadura soli TaxID=2508997 RepID=A0A5C4JFV4_9ACTN|nr:valine--tRNA ligase [Actinomadura soli]TMR04286.1 valine--tRNA ligase [Actinomadura soli]
MTQPSTQRGQGAAADVDLPTQYRPADVEGRLYDRWVSAGLFTAGQDGPPFSIVIPPPNVTGSLHMGHALDHSIQDTLVRRRRMQGHATVWVPGMDHAGIATQNVVERELAKEGLSRHDLGREAFVERVWQWKAESGGRILGQMRRLGDGVDWTREAFTMDDDRARAVRTIFKRLFDDGLIHRAERIINWCPRCLTALSDIEVEHEDVDGELVSIRYGSDDQEGDDAIVVATTRAETMLGDAAVAVHPGDPRYAHMVGREIELPLTGRRIPVVADEHVDPEFGTGAVKVTPAHDPNDFEIGRRHALASLPVMDERGVVTASGPFEGLDRFEARPAVVAALREQGRIVKEVRPYKHSVGHCQRCATVVEPRVSLQWFVKVESLAREAGDAVRDGRVKIHPPEMAARYFEWVDNMHDWCISRQLWWGHRIPVWYGPDGEVVCPGPDEEPPAGWTQDTDVLDTWFSSALWPFSTLGWPDETDDLKRFYPTSVLVTGYDILFFWVARMMMFGLYAMDGVQPFDTIALHGMVRDQYGKKMSKSFGNVIDPLDWIDEYGADATRFTLLRGANPGGDVPVAEQWAQGSRNFCNKLWNATRFALINGAHVRGEMPEKVTTVDAWVLSRLQTVIAEVDVHLESYDFAKACEALYHFAWDEVCDWYVELAKVQLADDRAEATRRVLGEVLDKLLRLLHPVIPFVTEELWTALCMTPSEPTSGGETIVTAPWPSAEPGRADKDAEALVESLQRLVTEVRRFRADQGLKPGQKVAAALEWSGSPLAAHEEGVRALLRLTEPGEGFAATASLPVEDVVVRLDTAGAIDVAAERRRLEKDLAAARKEVEQVGRKLGNEAFMAKAPEAVVAKNRDRLAQAEADIRRLESQLTALPAG